MPRCAFIPRSNSLLSRLVTLGAVLAFAAQGFAAGPWDANQVIQPPSLAKELRSPAGKKLKVLQVGFRTLYDQGHVPGSLYCGPASSISGLARLKGCLARIPKTAEIVLYCGCCPWRKCPNIRPAFKTLQAMGYTHVRVVEMDRNFGQDWQAKGYPTSSGRNP